MIKITSFQSVWWKYYRIRFRRKILNISDITFPNLCFLWDLEAWRTVQPIKHAKINRHTSKSNVFTPLLETWWQIWIGAIVIIPLFIDCRWGVRECQIAYFLPSFGTVVNINASSVWLGLYIRPINQTYVGAGKKKNIIKPFTYICRTSMLP